MPATQAAAPTSARRSGTADRVGYVIAVAVNVALLWVAPRLLEFGWPGFLTDRFDQVLPLLSASLIAGVVVNSCFLIRDRGRFRAVGDLVTAAFGVAVTIRLWSVFPFDFAGYDNDWSWLIRAVLALAIIGTSVAVIVQVVKLIRPTS